MGVEEIIEAEGGARQAESHTLNKDGRPPVGEAEGPESSEREQGEEDENGFEGLDETVRGESSVSVGDVAGRGREVDVVEEVEEFVH